MYVQPVYNLTVNIWRAIHNPITDPPDVVTLANLTWGRRVAAPIGSGGFGTGTTSPVLLVPKLTDIRSDEKCSGGDDFVEAPAGSGRYYIVTYVDDLGKGFGNEHRGAILQARPPWPAPIP